MPATGKLTKTSFEPVPEGARKRKMNVIVISVSKCSLHLLFWEVSLLTQRSVEVGFKLN